METIYAVLGAFDYGNNTEVLAIGRKKHMEEIVKKITEKAEIDASGYEEELDNRQKEVVEEIEDLGVSVKDYDTGYIPKIGLYRSGVWLLQEAKWGL